MERNLLCGKQNTLKHGYFSTIAAHFINLIIISQISQVWVADVSSKKYPS